MWNCLEIINFFKSHLFSKLTFIFTDVQPSCYNRPCWRIMDRCKFILDTFLFDGEMTAEVHKQKVTEARKKLDELGKQHDLLRQKLKTELDERFTLAIKGKEL